MLVVMTVLIAAMVSVSVIVTAATAALAMLVMMTVLIAVMVSVSVTMLFLKLGNRIGKCRSLFGGKKNVLTVKERPIGRNDHRIGIMLTHKRDRRIELFSRKTVGMTEYDCARRRDLVVKKLTKILHIHFAFLGIHNRRRAVQNERLVVKFLNSADNVGKLAHTRRFDHNAIGRISRHHLGKCLAEIADKRTANTARVHLVNRNTRISKKTAVYTDLTEFIFDQNNLLTLIGFLHELLDQRRFARAEKA